MGFADFLAGLAPGSPVSNIGEAFGGDPGGIRRKATDFLDNRLPGLLEEARRNTNPDNAMEIAPRIISEAIKAGIGPVGMKAIREQMIQPILDNMEARDVERLQRNISPYTRPTAGAQPPELPETTTFGLPAAGGPTPSGIAASGMTEAVPARSPTPSEMLGLGVSSMRAGRPVTPAGFQSLLETPAVIGQKEALASKEQAAASKEQRQARALEDIPDVLVPNTPFTYRQLAQATGGTGLGPLAVQMQPQREKPLDPLEEVRRKQIEASTAALLHAAGRPYPEAGGPHGSTEMQDYIRSGGDPTNREEFLAYLDRRRGAGKAGGGSETETTVPLRPEDTEMSLRTIAKEAKMSGDTSAENIKRLAKQRDLVIEGTPTITDVGTIFSDPRLSGDFSLKRAPKVTTKVPTGRPGPGPGTPTPAPGGAIPDSVMMVAPDGSTRAVPLNRVQEFQRKGAKIVGQ